MPMIESSLSEFPRILYVAGITSHEMPTEAMINNDRYVKELILKQTASKVTPDFRPLTTLLE